MQDKVQDIVQDKVQDNTRKSPILLGKCRISRIIENSSSKTGYLLIYHKRFLHIAMIWGNFRIFAHKIAKN